jgi:non-ribosomal peptide synthetase component F
VTGLTVHRIIEQHAAARGGAVAIDDGHRAITYRDLNCAANTLARRLQAHGFRRGAHAIVTMAPGIDLAITLLAILKMGGAYTWKEAPPFAPGTASVSFSTAPWARDSRVGPPSTEIQYLHLDLSSALAEPRTCSANLPIVTRDTDTACVLEEADGAPAVLVPHQTIAALRERAVPNPTPCSGDRGAFDLWMALMAGTTAVVESSAAAVAA